MQENFDLKNILKNEKILETAVIILFISLFVFLKFAQPWNYQLSHTSPAFYNANDNFANGYVYPQYIKETGNFIFEPEYVSGNKDVVGNMPVILSHLSAMLSILSGVETYDTSAIIIAFFSISTALLIYFSIRRHSKDLAILSLPFMIGVFNFDFEIARAFGLWIYITGAFFLTSIVWIADKLNEKYAAIIFALLLTGAALGHMSEAIFAAMFLAFYALLKYAKERTIDKIWIKNFAIGIAIFLILSTYYVIIFKYTWMVYLPYTFEVMSAPPFAPNYGVKLSDFGILLPLLAIGVIIGLKKLIFRKKDEFPFTPVAAGLFLLIIGYTNYIGFGIRAWQARISWPVYFAVFSAITLIYFWEKISKGNRKFMHAIILSIFLMSSFSYLHINKLQGDGIMDQNEWDGFMWLKNNTPENAKIAHFFSPYADQTFSIWSTDRKAYVVSREDYIDAAQKGFIKENYTVTIFYVLNPSNESSNKLASIINAPKFNGDINLDSKYTTQDMDYYVFVIGGSINPAVLNYNNAIRTDYIKRAIASEVYNNGGVAILKRNVVSK